ncbi:MAG TPA: alpha-amylase family protein [Bryobacterales bacterium]|nr:alpha-amylase family protein [Bryobacterales bacterium]
MKTPRIAVLLLAASVAGIFGLITAPSQSPAPAARPSWLHSTPLVLVSNHDSMPIFRRRVGGNPVWQEEDYEKREHSEEAIRKLKDLGVTLVITHFYKGFGLEAEREHQEKAKELVKWVRKYGMRLGVYVGSTIAYETFLLEKPEAEEWFVPDYLGRPVFYDNQTFRKRVYFMHPGYREYMRRVLRLAESPDFHADLIHFDNTSMQAEPAIFQHPLAIEQFREFLGAKYSPEQLKQRFGFSDVRYVLPPRYDRPLGAINDPLFQEWADFRCVQLTAYYAEMERLLRGLNPEVAVETNPHSGISGRNTIWEQGVDYPRLLAHLDAVWTEEGDPAGVTPDGILVSRIRTFKMASTLHNTLFVGTGGQGGSVLQMAESMAFGRQCLGDVGGTLAGYDLPQDQRRYIRFFHRYFEHYRDIDNVADVAVLHSFASMGYNNDRPHVSTLLAEQALIQSKVPFDVIFDDNLKDLSKYRVLVLADQECLNDDKLALIRRFVQNGGSLVATDDTSLYTEWRERRRNFGLRDLFGVDASTRRGARNAEATLPISPVRREFGRGRVAYIPAVRPAIEKPTGARTTFQYWKLPLNWKEIIGEVKWAAGGRLSLEVSAPPTVVAELTEQKQNNKLLVHLLNYNVAREASVQNVEVSVAVPESKKVASVTLLSPDTDASEPLRFTLQSGRAVFTVPALRTYDLGVVQLQ